MERRELIKLVSLATGSLLAVPLTNSLLVSCKEDIPKNDGNYSLQFFNFEDFILVKKLIDVILPQTDSPSATGVGVHKIIDMMVGTVYKPTERDNYNSAFKALKKHLNSSSKNQLTALQDLSKSLNENDNDAKMALLDLKQQTVAYYLTTEAISKKYLNYLPIPGKYEPCISLDDVNGKAWAL
ncbi:MAG: hypothetical protein DRJ07_02755 [Bacteroidetes bacterium]|nr:MAG: hypothetical protein DRJ07_02755 [Bacteroidota bacterium]